MWELADRTTATGNVHNQVTENVLKNNINENTQYIIHRQWKYKIFIEPGELTYQTVDSPMRFWHLTETKILNLNKNKGDQRWFYTETMGSRRSCIINNVEWTEEEWIWYLRHTDGDIIKKHRFFTKFPRKSSNLSSC